jgi:hypothetical protein
MSFNLDTLRRNRYVSAAIAMALGVALSPISAMAEGGERICLQNRDIERTKVLNDHQILFYTGQHKAYLNNLATKCSTLVREDGFSRTDASDEYCDNLVTIRVLRTGEACLLGKFTPYDKPT